MSQTAICVSCRKPQAQHECALCFEPVCKSCEFFLEEGTFAFLQSVHEDLRHSYYCAACYDRTVEPALAAYREKIEEAKQVFFFFDSRKKPIQVLKRAREIIEVTHCLDRDETILRLGFMAAELGFNAIVDAEVKGEKVRDHGFQKLNWRGKGWPAKVDRERLERHLAQEED
jgi:hypothetical protein